MQVRYSYQRKSNYVFKLPFGEEIAGLGNRTSAEKYVSDDVRQGFTGYEKDDETGLGFAQARMYKKELGRFTGADSLMASGLTGYPQTWNRYAYVLNNPLILIDPSGFYTCKGTTDQCSAFRTAKKRAEDQLGKIETIYGNTSDEYVKASKALEIYGCETSATCKDNGVIVKFDNSNGNNDVTIEGKQVIVNLDQDTFKEHPSEFKESEGIKAAGIVGHEGRHIINAKNAIERKKVDNNFQDEYDGHFVQAVILESFTRESKDRFVYLGGNNGQFTFDKEDIPKGIPFIQNMRKERIEKILKDDPSYGLTPTNKAGLAPSYVYSPSKRKGGK